MLGLLLDKLVWLLTLDINAVLVDVPIKVIEVGAVRDQSKELEEILDGLRTYNLNVEFIALYLHNLDPLRFLDSPLNSTKPVHLLVGRFEIFEESLFLCLADFRGGPRRQLRCGSLIASPGSRSLTGRPLLSYCSSCL
mgnify:CR=1 FL=1